MGRVNGVNINNGGRQKLWLWLLVPLTLLVMIDLRPHHTIPLSFFLSFYITPSPFLHCSSTHFSLSPPVFKNQQHPPFYAYPLLLISYPTCIWTRIVFREEETRSTVSWSEKTKKKKRKWWWEKKIWGWVWAWAFRRIETLLLPRHYRTSIIPCLPLSISSTSLPGLNLSLPQVCSCFQICSKSCFSCL